MEAGPCPGKVGRARDRQSGISNKWRRHERTSGRSCTSWRESQIDFIDNIAAVGIVSGLRFVYRMFVFFYFYFLSFFFGPVFLTNLFFLCVKVEPFLQVKKKT